MSRMAQGVGTLPRGAGKQHWLSWLCSLAMHLGTQGEKRH